MRIVTGGRWTKKGAMNSWANPVKRGKHRTEVTEDTEGVRRPWAPNPTRVKTRGQVDAGNPVAGRAKLRVG
jgi:hypothetical protein